MRRLFALQGLTIKAALVLGFGATFGLWLFAGLNLTRRMADVHAATASVNARYMRAQELLSTARAQVLLGSVYVRDALLDPDPASLDGYRQRLEEASDAAASALQLYVPVVDSIEERDRVAGLRREIERFRATSHEVLASDRRTWATDARLLLNGRIGPRRDNVVRISDEVQTLNRGAFVQQQGAVSTIYDETQRRVWQRLGLALAASLGIAVLATLYVGRLEQDVRRQRAKERQNAHDLQRLSAKLVTAQEEERRTIARELHDEVGQALMAIKVELAVVERAIEAKGGSEGLLADAQGITDTALHTVRDLSHLLHPAVLDDLGLTAAVEWYLSGFGRRHGLKVELLHEHMDDRLLPEIEAAAYRIVQEALTNVAKHAGATSCRVYLQRLRHTVLVTVEDNGSGFDTARPVDGKEARGLGLIGVRERVAQLSGSVRIESGPGRGTRLTVELPARPRVEAPDADDSAEETAADALPKPEALLG